MYVSAAAVTARGSGVVEGNSERILERRARASERECVCMRV